MNKKVVKIITFILTVLLVLGVVATTVNAAITPDVLSSAASGVSAEGEAGLITMAGKVMAFIRNIAIVGGVIILMILGVKYMTGSLEEKADYKKSLIPLVVGILVVMAATTIMTFVLGFFK